ncbi:MAG: CotH kinase family protein [Patescibacteria group bacterium]
MKTLILRRNIWILSLTVISVTTLLFLGSIRIIPYVTSTSGSSIGYYCITNTVDLFDDLTIHEIAIHMDDDDYEEMITTYKETSEKEYYKVDVEIDGVLIEDVGIRLKGNLTLNTALGTTNNMDIGKDRMNEFPGDMNVGEMPNMEEMQAFMQKGQVPNFEGINEGGFGGMSGGQVPYLLKFDEFITGQTYEGYTEIAIRTGDTAQLAEQIAYYAYALAGVTAPQTSYASVTINGETQLYSLAQNIDESFVVEHFENSDGVLYKAGNFVQFEYLGDDPSLYVESFEQKTNINDDDLTPLIKFLQFVTESSDKEFEEQLSDWLDINSFMAMMALDELLGNSDSFVGMGSNFFLYFDNELEQFTLLSWDANMSLGSGMGGGMGRGMDQDEQGQLEMQGIWQNQGELPENFAGVKGAQFGVIGEEREGGMKSGSNILKDRFFANEKFSAMYEDVYENLETLLYRSDILLKQTEELSVVFEQYNKEHGIVDEEEYNKSVNNIVSYIEQKMVEID